MMTKPHAASLLLAAGAAFVFCLPVDAQGADPMIEFTVVKADTLIGLSREVLVSPHAWHEVARINHLPDPDLILPGQVLRIPVRLLRATPQPAKLVSSVGDVKLADVPLTEPPATGRPIAPGQSVQTGSTGSAVIELADGSRVRLPPSSLAQVSANQTYGARASEGATNGWFASTLRLLRGSAEIFATKVLRVKPLEVATPTAVVGVRGTQFRVSFDEAANATTHSEVVEGRVRFDTAGRSTGADLDAGFGAATDSGAGAPRATRLLESPDLTVIPQRFETPLVRFAVPGPATPLRVQVANDAAFDRIVSDQRVDAGAEIRIAGLDDATWFLRVRRIGDQGIEGFDATRPFVLKARPEPPAYQAPRADAKQSVGSVEFAWARNVQAPQARLQVAEDAGFQRLREDRAPLDDNRLSTDLKEPGTYFWRMASVRPDGDQGPFGQTQRFELRPDPEPASGGLAGDGRSLVFKWRGREQDRHEVQLSRDAGFGQVEAQETLVAPEWSLPTPSRSGRYYFRYRSIEPDGYVSPFSAPLEIDIPFDWTPLLLFAPMLMLLL